jgi:hypothetical protein
MLTMHAGHGPFTGHDCLSSVSSLTYVRAGRTSPNTTMVMSCLPQDTPAEQKAEWYKLGLQLLAQVQPSCLQAAHLQKPVYVSHVTAHAYAAHCLCQCPACLRPRACNVLWRMCCVCAGQGWCAAVGWWPRYTAGQRTAKGAHCYYTARARLNSHQQRQATHSTQHSPTQQLLHQACRPTGSANYYVMSLHVPPHIWQLPHLSAPALHGDHRPRVLASCPCCSVERLMCRAATTLACPPTSPCSSCMQSACWQCSAWRQQRQALAARQHRYLGTS